MNVHLCRPRAELGWGRAAVTLKAGLTELTSGGNMALAQVLILREFTTAIASQIH